MEPSTLIPLYVDSELDITIMAIFPLLFYLRQQYMSIHHHQQSRLEPSVSFYIISEQAQYQICNIHNEEKH